MSTTPINLGSSTAMDTSTVSAASSAADLANQNVFLQLLVAQLKNQDPNNPVDGTTFITQLAQFSELSNSTQELANTAAMAADLSSIQQELAAAAAGAHATAPTAAPPASVPGASGTTARAASSQIL
jgi:flagellar basal-body rod modification protein FlgD